MTTFCIAFLSFYCPAWHSLFFYLGSSEMPDITITLILAFQTKKPTYLKHLKLFFYLIYAKACWDYIRGLKRFIPDNCVVFRMGNQKWHIYIQITYNVSTPPPTRITHHKRGKRRGQGQILYLYLYLFLYRKPHIWSLKGWCDEMNTFSGL